MMNPGFISVPFKTESEHGLTSFNGVAKFSSAGVVLEFEGKFFGLISEGVKEVRLPVAEILDINFKKGFFRAGAKIVLRTRSFAALAELPNKNGRMTLKLAREDFERGRDAVLQMQKELQAFQAQLPPPHPGVSSLFHDESEEETQELK